MIYFFLFFWIIGAILIMREEKIVRIIIYLGIFSLISAACFLLLAAPDVAMAEAAVSAFSTVFFIVCFEKYYEHVVHDAERAPGVIATKTSHRKLGRLFPYHAAPSSFIFPIVFTLALLALFLAAVPSSEVNAFLKIKYTALFAYDVGGENAVTAIYLGYRVYDTLFEALMLLISVIAITHLSWFDDTFVAEGKRSEVDRSPIAVVTIRLICPVMLLFGAYLIANGHISPGGGFQGGVAIAAFFICRYMIYDIYDIRISSIIRMEKSIFAAIVLWVVFFILLGTTHYFPVFQSMYLLIINALIGLKVACGFIIIFYRYIAFERR